MIVGKKVIQADEVVAIQEDVMEVTKLIRDDQRMLIYLNKLQDVVEDKFEMQEQQAKKIIQLINMSISEGVQIEEGINPKLLANIQNLCGSSFNFRESS